MDDFDLLEAKIDPRDIKSLGKIQRLEEEIESEKALIKLKFLQKYAFQPHDPLKMVE